jgi:hypothetical protein
MPVWAGTGGGAGLFPRGLAPPGPGGTPRLPSPARPDGRQGDHPQHRGGGAHKAYPPHLRGGATSQRGVLASAQQAHHHLEHAARPRHTHPCPPLMVFFFYK